jgi:hypothetical protein
MKMKFILKALCLPVLAFMIGCGDKDENGEIWTDDGTEKVPDYPTDEIDLGPSNDRIPVIANIQNSVYAHYNYIGYSLRKQEGGPSNPNANTNWTDGSNAATDMTGAYLTHFKLGYYDNPVVNKTADLLDMLNIAQQYGLKVIAYTCRTLEPSGNYSNITTDLQNGSLASHINALKNHPALEAWSVKDEPVESEFSTIASVITSLKGIDAGHPSYTNLFPNYYSAYSKAEDYRRYVHNFIETVQPAFVSYDNYPVVSTGHSVRPGFFENVEIIADEAKIANIPFWAYVLTASHYDYPEPMLGDLRFQIYVNLAYGAQAIQYFNWWNGDATFNPAVYNYSPAGKNMPVYSRLVTAGLEIKNLSRVFKDAKMLKVRYTPNMDNEAPFQGTALLSQSDLPSVVKSINVPKTTPALVSLMEKGNDNYLVIVNTSPVNDLTLSIDLEAGVREITKRNTAFYVSGVQQKTLTGGDCVIYQWTEK